MDAKKYRWSTVYESAEEELLDFLESRHITATRQEIESGSSQTVPASADGYRLWCAEGAAILVINTKRFSIQPGDVLEIPPQAECAITTSLSNFAWYQENRAEASTT